MRGEPETAIARKTYIYDSIRNACSGALDTAFLTIGLLVAIRIFHAPSQIKAVLVAVSWFGGFFAPLMLRFASARNFRSNTTISGLLFGTGMCLALSAYVNSLLLFVFLMTLASICHRVETPFILQIYTQNYLPTERASRFSLGLMLSAIVAVVFGQCSGLVMDWSLSYYRWILLAVAGLAFLGALAMQRVPSQTVLCPKENRHFWHYFRYLKTDGTFRNFTIYYFLVGLAYQMLIPVKVEYLANPVYQLNFSNVIVMLLAWVVPGVARICSTPLFGKLFDRTHLLTTRLVVNFFTIAAFVIFFNTRHLVGLFLGAIFMGLAMSGSFLLHTLWISKIAPEERVSSYMSVYVFITSLRSILAPLLAYVIMSQTSATFTGNVGVVLAVISTIGFFSMRKDPNIR